MSGLIKHNVVKSVTDLQELLSGKHPLSDLRLGEVLVEERLISIEQLAAALSRQKKLGRDKHLGQILTEMGVLSQEQVILALSKKLGIPRVQLRGFDLPAHPEPLISWESAMRIFEK